MFVPDPVYKNGDSHFPHIFLRNIYCGKERGRGLGKQYVINRNDGYFANAFRVPGRIERYRGRAGHYPEKALEDEIYRNRENLTFCKLHGIRLSSSSLGRPKKDAVIDKKKEYADNADRVEVERSFSLAKRCYGLGKIMTKLDVTTRSSIALSILVMNAACIAARSLHQFLTVLFFRYK